MLPRQHFTGQYKSTFPTEFLTGVFGDRLIWHKARPESPTQLGTKNGPTQPGGVSKNGPTQLGTMTRAGFLHAPAQTLPQEPTLQMPMI